MDKEAFNTEFDRRMKDFESGTAKKPRRTKFPQQQYACCCPTMRTYRGDILSSTCKDCIKNGTSIPDCRSGKCQCQTGIFYEKDIIKMATKKLRRDELKAREHVPDKDERAFKNFSQILSSSVRDGIKSLTKSNSSLDKRNVLSAAAAHMSRKQMPSEDQLHSLQKSQPLTMRLQESGADVRNALEANPRRKGKRHYRNGLG